MDSETLARALPVSWSLQRQPRHSNWLKHCTASLQAKLTRCSHGTPPSSFAISEPSPVDAPINVVTPASVSAHRPTGGGVMDDTAGAGASFTLKTTDLLTVVPSDVAADKLH